MLNRVRSPSPTRSSLTSETTVKRTRRFRGRRASTLLAFAAVLLLAGCLPVAQAPTTGTASPTTTTSTTTTTTTLAPTLSPPKVYPPCPSTGPTATQVVLDGDSLVAQAGGEFTSRVCTPSVNVGVFGQPGAALCDFDSFIAGQAAAVPPPRIVVIAFSGNNDTPCVEDTTGKPLVGAALLAKYRADAEADTALFTAGVTKVLWVTPPGHVGDTQEPPLAAVYQQVVNDHPGVATLVDGGKYLRDTTGTYQLDLPCQADEVSLTSCQGGQIDVRLPTDGFHLCPVLVPLGPCPVYDAGGVRYGRAIAEGVHQALGG